MTGSIVIPLDGTSSGERALPYAFSIARRARARVHFVHVQNCFASIKASIPALARGMPELESGENGREYLQGLRQRMLFDQVAEVETATIEGNAVGALAQFVRDVRASILVMGIEGREDAERLLVDESGGGSSGLSMPPLLLVPAAPGNVVEEDDARLTSLLLPMDDASDAEDAIEPALDLMKLFGGEGVILHVVDNGEAECGLPFSRDPAVGSAAVDRLFEARFRFEELIERERRRGNRLDLKVVENAYPADGILEEAESGDANWMAISCQQRRRLSQQVFGSIAGRILQDSRIPVLVRFSHEG